MEIDRKRYPHQMKSNPKYFYTDLMVLHSNAGYYIGRIGFNAEDGPERAYEEPYSRESDYYRTREEAELALKEGFVVRQSLENDSAYESGNLPRLPTRSVH